MMPTLKKKSNHWLILSLAITLVSVPAFAKKNADSVGGTHSVNGHFKKNGTYVQPHNATNPNQTQKDNWSRGIAKA